MKGEQASYRYTKQGLSLRVISEGVSKTHIREFLRKIPANHMKRLNTLYFVDHLPDYLRKHEWESKEAHKNYNAVYYRTQGGEMNIAIYIDRKFLSSIYKNRVWVHLIRQAILHEIGHHLVDLSGKNTLFNEREMEDFVDRYTERRSNTRVLIMKPYQLLEKYDRHWVEIERMV